MLKKHKKFLYYWLPIFVYCSLIYLQSSYPSPDSMPEIPYFDKFLHIVAYALLGALFLRALRTLSIRNNTFLIMTLSVLLSTLYGISDELHQYFVPYRHADLADAIADMVGSIIGVPVYQRLVTTAGPFLIKILD